MMGALPNTSAPNLSMEPDPILFGKLAGRHELRIKIKQGDGVVGPKASTQVHNFHIVQLLLHSYLILSLF